MGLIHLPIRQAIFHSCHCGPDEKPGMSFHVLPEAQKPFFFKVANDIFMIFNWKIIVLQCWADVHCAAM